MELATGINVVLDATQEEFQAIKVVRLFFALWWLRSAENEDHSPTLPLRLHHEHFAVFAQALGLNGILYSYDEVNKTCRAVDLYMRAKQSSGDPEGTLVAWRFYFFGFSIPALNEWCLHCAKSAGIEKDLPELQAAISVFFVAIDARRSSSANL